MKRIAVLVGALMAMNATGGAATAQDYDASLLAIAEDARVWAADPTVIAAVRAQNAETADIEQAEIDSLDAQWRAEVGAGDTPLIDEVSGRDASAALVDIRDGAEGLITEIFVMDAHGLNVAVSDVTSDYWQGDEAKWAETYLVGPDAVHLGDVEFDESTQAFQSQVSVTVVDPDSGEPIGAMTIGVNLEFLE